MRISLSFRSTARSLVGFAGIVWLQACDASGDGLSNLQQKVVTVRPLPDRTAAQIDLDYAPAGEKRGEACKELRLTARVNGVSLGSSGGRRHAPGTSLESCSRPAFVATKDVVVGAGASASGRPDRIEISDETQTIVVEVQGLFSVPAAAGAASRPTVTRCEGASRCEIAE